MARGSRLGAAGSRMWVAKGQGISALKFTIVNRECPSYCAAAGLHDSASPPDSQSPSKKSQLTESQSQVTVTVARSRGVAESVYRIFNHRLTNLSRRPAPCCDPSLTSGRPKYPHLTYSINLESQLATCAVLALLHSDLLPILPYTQATNSIRRDSSLTHITQIDPTYCSLNVLVGSIRDPFHLRIFQSQPLR